jgi:hypothetical protein
MLRNRSRRGRLLIAASTFAAFAAQPRRPPHPHHHAGRGERRHDGEEIGRRSPQRFEHDRDGEVEHREREQPGEKAREQARGRIGAVERTGEHRQHGPGDREREQDPREPRPEERRAEHHRGGERGGGHDAHRELDAGHVHRAARRRNARQRREEEGQRREGGAIPPSGGAESRQRTPRRRTCHA